jgi:hypothetical protein
MDSRAVMSPVCSVQGTADVINDITSIPPSRLSADHLGIATYLLTIGKA